MSKNNNGLRVPALHEALYRLTGTLETMYDIYDVEYLSENILIPLEELEQLKHFLEQEIKAEEINDSNAKK